MPASTQLNVFGRLCGALAVEDPERALSAVLSILAEIGIVPRQHHPEAWCELEVEGRALQLALVAKAQPPDVALRELVLNVLRAALRRAAQHEAYRKLHERMEMLSGASFEGIFIHVDGVVIDANQRLEEMLGYERNGALGSETLRRCVAPEDLPHVLHRMANRIEGEYVITGVRTDGSRFRAELLSKQGHLGTQPVRVVAVRDVTQRERTSEMLRESEARLRDLAEQAFDFILYSRDGVIVEVGGAVERVLGCTRAQLLGKQTTGFMKLSPQVVAERRLGSFESVAKNVQGELVPVAVVAVMSTLDGEPVRVAGLRDLRDVKRFAEERRTLEQQIERSQRLDSLGVLAGGIAHDFNNLLVGVIGNAELLIERVTDARDREAAQAIRSAGERAASLTTQMLAYAGHRDPGRRESIDLGSLWQELRTLLAASLSKKAQIELAIEPASIVSGNRATIMQVLMNLLTNASDALEDKPGSIEVRARHLANPDSRWLAALGATVRPGAWVLVEVRDTGIGMDEATLGRAFEPFFSTKPRGHGLGLAACLGIVRSHGGAMLVDSTQGLGSCFSVLWPAAEPIGPAHQEVPSATPSKCQVLVVDDEPAVRSLLKRLLVMRGYTVREASGGIEALEQLALMPVDIVVLDVTMPDLSGIEVVSRIRASGSLVKIVLCSGYLDVSAERELEPGSFQGFVRKPYRVAELIEALERALAS